MLNLLEQIGELLGRLAERYPAQYDLTLRRVSRIKTIQGSLQIEGNPLTVEQVTAVLDGKRVLAAPRDVQEIHNAMEAYDGLDTWEPDSQTDMLAAHALMMKGLVDNPGQYRSGSVGVKKGESVVHIRMIREGHEEADDALEVLERAEQRILGISRRQYRQEILPLSNIVMETVDRIEEFQGKPGLIRGVPTGFPDLDKITSGFHKANLIILAARAGMGKTALALNLARNAAVEAGVPLSSFPSK